MVKAWLPVDGHGALRVGRDFVDDAGGQADDVFAGRVGWRGGGVGRWSAAEDPLEESHHGHVADQGSVGRLFDQVEDDAQRSLHDLFQPDPVGSRGSALLVQQTDMLFTHERQCF